MRARDIRHHIFVPALEAIEMGAISWGYLEA
jgi:hypothetical protein